MGRKTKLSSEELEIVFNRICERPECHNPLTRNLGLPLVVFQRRRFCSKKCAAINKESKRLRPYVGNGGRKCKRDGCNNQLTRRSDESVSKFWKKRLYCSELCRAGKGMRRVKPETCLVCGSNNWLRLTKPHNESPPQRQCRVCKNQRQKAYIEKTPIARTRKKLLTRNSKLRKYGLTPEAFEQLKQAQDNRCLLCNALPTHKHNLHIDHCHQTNKIRGLLCGSCNRAIGLFKDDPIRLNKAAEYLLRSRCLG